MNKQRLIPGYRIFFAFVVLWGFQVSAQVKFEKGFLLIIQIAGLNV